MKNFLLTKTFVVLLAFLVLSLGVASASLIPCTVENGGLDNPVTASTVVICGSRPLTISRS